MCECFLFLEVALEMCRLLIPSQEAVSCAFPDESLFPYVGPQYIPVLLDPTLLESFTLTNLCALLAYSFLSHWSE